MNNFTFTIKYCAEEPIYPFDTVEVVKLASKSYSNVLAAFKFDLERASKEGLIMPPMDSGSILQTTPKRKRTRPTDIWINDEGIVYISEFCLRVSLFTIEGKLLARWGNEGQDKETALFLAPHSIAVDSKGDIYVGEVSKTYAGVDRGPRTVQKFARRI